MENQHIPTRDFAEAVRTDCFLCYPNRLLLVHASNDGQVLAGLGPVVDGYCVISSRKHVQSSDLTLAQRTAYCGYVEEVRKLLSRKFGSCLITEHGKLPVCFADETPDQHCFHPHFLAFPSAPNIQLEAHNFFDSSQVFNELSAAVEFGMSKPQYLLVSPSSSICEVFYDVSVLPRQVARALVAEVLGKPGIADWRKHPNQDGAESIAKNLRALLAENLSDAGTADK